MKINKYLYITALLVLCSQSYYILTNDFSGLDYFVISATTILYGGCMALSLKFVKSEESD